MELISFFPVRFKNKSLLMLSFPKLTSARTIIFLLGLFLVGANSQSIAQVEVRDIQVDVTAESGLKARDMGIAEARRKAFQALLESNPNLAESLNGRTQPSDKDLEYATETFEIQNEKISATRYIGTLTITFSASGMERLLSGDFDYADTSAKNTQKEDSDGAQKSGVETKSHELNHDRNVVLVPLYVTPDESLLWAKNPWREFWQHTKNQVGSDGVLQTTIPLGDLQDILSTSIEDFMTNRAGNVQKLLNRYEKKTLLFVTLRRFSLEGPDFELSLKIFRDNAIVFSSQPQSLTAESDDEMYAVARIETIKTLQDFEASAAKMQNTAIQTLSVDAQFSSFMQWQAIRKALRMSGVDSFSVANLTRRSAKIRLKSSLSISDLQIAFMNQGIRFEESLPGSYRLYVGQ